MAEPRLIVVMGVTSSGKSTLGRALAARLDASFLEGDDFHPAANIDKMTRGLALDDNDRAPWLAAIAEEIARHDKLEQSAVFTCSALKRAYRDRLRQGSKRLRFVFVDGERDLIASRMARRSGHFMPPGLLPSQLQTLERPDGEADVIRIDNRHTVESLVEQVEKALSAA